MTGRGRGACAFVLVALGCARGHEPAPTARSRPKLASPVITPVSSKAPIDSAPPCATLDQDDGFDPDEDATPAP